MAELNPLAVIAEGLAKAQASGDRDAVGHILAETLATLQIDNTDDDAFTMLGEAIGEAGSQDPAANALLIEVWSEFEARRQAP